MIRSLSFAAFCCLGMVVAHAAVPSPRSKGRVAHPELAATAHAVVERGFHAELPPHISTLLGLTREEKRAVVQGLLRSPGKIEGIDVAEKNHADIVIFIVDETTNKQTLYLSSPSGVLRRLLLVEKGVGRVAKPARSDMEIFQAEKKMWKERMTAAEK